MTFPYNAYLAAFIAAFVASAFSQPFWRWMCVRSDLVDDPGHRKDHSTSTPLSGGLSVLTGLLFPILVGITLLSSNLLESNSIENPFSYGLDRRKFQLIAILAGAGAMVILGCIDDKYELRPATKFTGQFLIAALVAASGVRITLFVPNILFSYFVTILWILTLVNAFNFMDNMNGLCTGLGIIGAGIFGGLAARDGHYLVASLGLLTAGALAGFLPYNFPKARAFLGDAGSHLVGYLMAIMGILPHFYTPEKRHAFAVFAPLIVLAVPLLDLVWVVLLRWKMGQPFYIGDTNHLSHRLVKRGMSKTKAVIVIWLIAAAVATTTLLL